MFFNWLGHVTGLDDGSGPWYLLWSGFLPDLTIIVGVFAWIARHNCHVTGCFRLGRHPVRGTPYITCRRHHPDDDLSAAHVVRRHAEFKAREGTA